MGADDFVAQVEGVAALAEPLRRELYLYVAAQPAPVTRDQAAAALDIPRHTVKFHLDKLVEEGLLTTDFKRLSGREGPGAGRPNKRYRRSARQFSVALPERRYDLAGQLLATAIDDAARAGTPVLEALRRVAAEEGAAIGDRIRAQLAGRSSRDKRVAAVCETLAEYGYEPRRAPHELLLVNCPFHLLAAEHTDLVCGMNLALIEAAVARLGDEGLTTRLDPAADRCCVVIAT